MHANRKRIQDQRTYTLSFLFKPHVCVCACVSAQAHAQAHAYAIHIGREAMLSKCDINRFL